MGTTREETGGGVGLMGPDVILPWGRASYPELFSTDSGLCCVHLSFSSHSSSRLPTLWHPALV